MPRPFFCEGMEPVRLFVGAWILFAVAATVTGCSGTSETTTGTATAAAADTRTPTATTVAATASSVPSVTATSVVRATATLPASATATATATVAATATATATVVQPTSVPPTASPTASPTPSVPSQATIRLVGRVVFHFSPAEVEIARGGTVTWEWVAGVHNVVGEGPIDAPTIFSEPGHTYATTFPAAGVFAFKCDVHPADMNGTVSVR